MSPIDPDDDPASHPENEQTASETFRAQPARGATQLTVQQLALQVVTGPDAVAKIVLKNDRAVLGKHPSCDVVLRDRTVSRFHCEIAIVNGRITIRDLDSMNGTFVDGVSVLAAHIQPGSMIGLGATNLLVDVAAEPVQVALSARDTFGTMVGQSLAMRRVFALLERAAASDATVLIEGETGTGKEAVAESIHAESSRVKGPFVVVDCSAIPSNLLESELFGHERGSFTGAVASREGAFLAADGGTIFLDEIGELALELQPKLLRALERREIKKVGGDKYQPVDVRVIAATNRGLKGEVNSKRFRSDLYYRLAVFQVRLPPLRDRVEDLPLLAEHLLRRRGADDQEVRELLTSEFMADLRRHAWPGNVRELRNYVEQCQAMQERLPIVSGGDSASMPVVTGGPPPIDPNVPIREAREAWVRAFEKEYLEKLLEKHGGNVTAAARGAGVDRIHFYRLLRRAGLK